MNLAVSSGHLWEIEMAPTVFGIVYVLIVSFQCLLFVFGRRFKNIFLMFFITMYTRMILTSEE